MVLHVAVWLWLGSSPTALCCPLPTINGKVWLKVIVCGIFPRIADHNSMRMWSAVSRIVCFIKAITNIYTMLAPTDIKRVVIATTVRTRTKGMIMGTCRIGTSRMCMHRKFPDSFMLFGSSSKQLYMVAGYCVLIHYPCPRWLGYGCATLLLGRHTPY